MLKNCQLIIYVVLFLLPIAGCTWLGVERQEVIEKEIETINSKIVNPEHSESKVISRGFTFNQILALLGKSEIRYLPNDEKLLVYPAAYEVRSGTTVCLALIPIPMRTSKKGEYRFYFKNEKLYKITKLINKNGFYGVYIDDSGSGVANGNKSKCDI